MSKCYYESPLELSHHGDSRWFQIPDLSTPYTEIPEWKVWYYPWNFSNFKVITCMIWIFNTSQYQWLDCEFKYKTIFYSVALTAHFSDWNLVRYATMIISLKGFIHGILKADFLSLWLNIYCCENFDIMGSIHMCTCTFKRTTTRSLAPGI